MELKRLKTRQTTLEHSKNSEFNNLSRNYAINPKTNQNLLIK